MDISDNCLKSTQPSSSDESLFGKINFSEEELVRIESECTQYSHEKNNKSPPNTFEELINKANSIFAVNGWSHSVMHQTIEYIESDSGKYNVGVSSLTRVTLKDGTYHEDIGFGISRGMKCRGSAIGKARKLAAEDGVINAFRSFGVQKLSGKITEYFSPNKTPTKRTLNYDNNFAYSSQVLSQPGCSSTSNNEQHIKSEVPDNEEIQCISGFTNSSAEKKRRKIKQLQLEIESREKLRKRLLLESEMV